MSKLKSLRLKQNVKQIVLTNSFNLSKGCISQWENGTRTPPVEMLPKLAEVLNCSIEELVYAIIETKTRVKEKDLQNKL